MEIRVGDKLKVTFGNKNIRELVVTYEMLGAIGCEAFNLSNKPYPVKIEIVKGKQASGR